MTPMCQECLELFGVPLYAAHHTDGKPRRNRHVRRVRSVTTLAKGDALKNASLAGAPPGGKRPR